MLAMSLLLFRLMLSLLFLWLCAKAVAVAMSLFKWCNIATTTIIACNSLLNQQQIFNYNNILAVFICSVQFCSFFVLPCFRSVLLAIMRTVFLYFVISVARCCIVIVISDIGAFSKYMVQEKSIHLLILNSNRANTHTDNICNMPLYIS